jgi:DNA topoisomerase I
MDKENSRDSFTLVICEKPSAAKRIAEALVSGKKINARKIFPIPVFDIRSGNGQHYVICSALGHLYSLRSSTKNRSTYPVYDFAWAPLNSMRTMLAVKTISDISRKAKNFIHACDYDHEGEVIGYNILQYACNNKYSISLRAKFSTLSDSDILNSFSNLSKPSVMLAESGKSRHVLDFIYGINLSRALSDLIKATTALQMYSKISIGRVQGPTLAFVTDRETQIRTHLPVPYWTISARFEKGEHIIEAALEKGNVDNFQEASKIVNSCLGRTGRVIEVISKNVEHHPYPPFSLGDLQMEAHKIFGFLPEYTLSIAEQLYLHAIISYPRTSSQKLPKSIDFKIILEGLSTIKQEYKDLVNMLFSHRPNLNPTEGQATDPAHPAIYPTGNKLGKKLNQNEHRLFDLIAKRFISCFADLAVTLMKIIRISVCNEYIFKTHGKSLLEAGWYAYYHPYYQFKESPIPEVIEGEVLKNQDIVLHENLTLPPYRYNQATLLERMEREQIGTKGTRAEIIKTLSKRNYVEYEIMHGLKPTELGFRVIESMRNYVPDIISVDLTKRIEASLRKIENGQMDSRLVIQSASDILERNLSLIKDDLKYKRRNIRMSTMRGENQGSKTNTRIIGRCPVCQTGNLMIVRSIKSKKRFVGCSSYYEENCRALSPIPQKGIVRTTKKNCVVCRWPIIKIVLNRNWRSPWELCANINCPLKSIERKSSKNQ